MCKIFQKNGFNITSNVNVKNVNFLDIQLDLQENTYRPYMKPNSTPIYVNRKSYHPGSVLENIPKSVNLRLSKISSSKEIFDSACPPYQEALNKSGYNYKLAFNPNLPSARNEPNRKRNITYFNPPFSCSVKTNIGCKFLKLIDTLFPDGHTLKQIINRNTVKISYRCMPKISNHNFEILKSEEQSQ